MENECEALPGVAYPGVRDNRSTLDTKTGYDDDDNSMPSDMQVFQFQFHECVCVNITVHQSGYGD